MVWRGLGLVTRKKREGIKVISRNRASEGIFSPPPLGTALALALTLSLIHDTFAGGVGDGHRGGGRIFVFAEASGGSGVGSGIGGGVLSGGSSFSPPSNVGVAVAVTAMAGIALAATFVYSRS